MGAPIHHMEFANLGRHNGTAGAIVSAEPSLPNDLAVAANLASGSIRRRGQAARSCNASSCSCIAALAIELKI